MNVQEWLKESSKQLKSWLKGHEMHPKDLREKLEQIPRKAWMKIEEGKEPLLRTEFYALVWRETGLEIFNPIQLPTEPRKVGQEYINIPQPWTQQELDNWLGVTQPEHSAEEVQQALEEPESEGKKWALERARQLRSYVDEHHYRPMNKFAIEQQMPDSVWRTIIEGKSVVEKKEWQGWYADITLATGMLEFDPRTIPDRPIWVPKREYFMNKSRRWTDADWEEWLAAHPEKRARYHELFEGEKSQPQIMPLSLKPQSQPMSLFDAMLVDVIAQAVQQTLETVVPTLRAAVREEMVGLIPQPQPTLKAVKAEETGPDQIRNLISKLNSSLVKAFKASPDEKEAFSDEYGHRLTGLIAAINALSPNLAKPRGELNLKETISLVSQGLRGYVQEASEQDRDELLEEVGFELGEVASWARLLIQPKPERERDIATQRAVGGEIKL